MLGNKKKFMAIFMSCVVLFNINIKANSLNNNLDDNDEISLVQITNTSIVRSVDEPGNTIQNDDIINDNILANNETEVIDENLENIKIVSQEADIKTEPTKSVFAVLPDLSIVDIGKNGSLEGLRPSYIDFTIRNFGGSTTTNIEVAVLVDNKSVGVFQVASLQGGYSRTLSLELNEIPGGNHTVTFTANPNRKIVESNYSNNSKSVTYNWNGIADLVALENSSPYKDTQNFKPGVDVPFTFKVYNGGNATAYGNIEIGIEIDGKYYYFTSYTNQGAKETVTMQTYINFANDGVNMKNINLVVDKYNRISEYTKMNNQNNINYKFYDSVEEPPKYGARFMNFGWPTKKIPIKAYSFIPEWQNPLDNALKSWNDAKANVTFEKNNSSINEVYVGKFSFPGLGATTHVTYADDRTKVYQFAIALNQDYIVAFHSVEGGSNDISKLIQSAFAHELGHCVWLADNPNVVVYETLMNTNRNRYKIYTPQYYDIEGVKSKYK